MSQRTILVVEDDPVLQTLVMDMLEEAGVPAVHRENGDEALGYLLDNPGEVAAVFTDIVMPGNMDGLHLAEIIGRHWPKIEVLMTSGWVQPSQTLPQNVCFIPKPWAPDQVVSAMRSALAAA